MIKFITKKSVSPFAKDTSFSFLPLMMMFMVFMATLAIGAVSAINSMTNHWNQSISGSLTIQIIPSSQKKEGVDATETSVETALILLKEIEGVIDAKVLDSGEIKKLLEPWLGSSDIIEDIPLPRLIDVKIKNNDTKIVEEIEEVLEKHVPSASLDSHKIWTAKLAKLVNSLKVLSFFAFYLVVGATVFTVIYATRTSLAVHKPVIGLLHLIGARDSYISMQYAKRTFVLAFLGGFIGFIIATPAIIFIGSLAYNLGGGALASLSLGRNEWVLMIFIPVSTALLSMLTAYFTVQRDLLRLL